MDILFPIIFLHFMEQLTNRYFTCKNIELLNNCNIIFGLLLWKENACGAVAAVEAARLDILGGYYRLQDLVSKDASSPIWQYLGSTWENKVSQGIWIRLHVVSAVSMCNMYSNPGNSTNLWR